MPFFLIASTLLFTLHEFKSCCTTMAENIFEENYCVSIIRYGLPSFKTLE